MLFNIPYNNGWNASIDGKKVKIHKVVDNLMAINLKSGHHQVVLNYQVPGLKLGWIVSTISIILFIGFNYLIRKRNKD